MTVLLQQIPTYAPWLFAFAALTIGVYRADRWAWPGDVLLCALGFVHWTALICACMLYLARRWPTWCADVAHAAPLLAWRVLLPALPERQQAALQLTAPLPATGATTVLPPSPLAMHEWMRQINDIPDLIPHVAATGRTGAGKTTLIQLALGWRPGDLVICTPKHQNDDAWAGFPAVRAIVTSGGIDLSPIKAAIDTVYAEWLRRSGAGARRETDLTLAIDEYTRTAQKYPDVRTKILEIAGSGRSAGIRLILLDTESNVDAWDWKGRGEARKNFLFIECHVDMRTLARSARMGLWGEGMVAIDVQHVVHHAAQVQLRARAWPGLAYLPTPVCASVSASAPPISLREPPQTDADTDAADALEARILMYAEWRKAKITKEMARTIRQSAGLGLDNNEWAEAGKR